MTWLSLLHPLLKLAVSLAGWLRERRLLAAGEAKGRAEGEANHARSAMEQGRRMREIAAHPPSRNEVQKRLEEGSG